MMDLDRNSTTSLFAQIEANLKSNIENGIYKAGKKLPTEIELMETFNVSRITIRRAVENLTKEGLLEKKQGKGTFVKEKKITRKISHTISFSDACYQSGLTPSSVLISRDILNVSSLNLDEKDIFNDDKVIYTKRIRMADNQPVIFENNYFPYSRFSFLMNEPMTGSLYNLLKDKYSIKIGSPKKSYIDITTAYYEQAKFLNVTSGEPLFLLSTEIYDTDGNLIHLGKQYIVGSRYRFYLDD